MLPPPPVSSVYSRAYIHSLYRTCGRKSERASASDFPLRFSLPPTTIRARRPCFLPLSRRALIPIRKQHRHQVVVATRGRTRSRLANDADSPDDDSSPPYGEPLVRLNYCHYDESDIACAKK